MDHKKDEEKVSVFQAVTQKTIHSYADNDDVPKQSIFKRTYGIQM